MARSLRTVALMLLAPPLWLYVLALAGVLRTHSKPLGLAMLAGAWAVRVAGIAFSGWRSDVQLIVVMAYTVAAIFMIPWLTFLALCLTGYCI